MITDLLSCSAAGVVAMTSQSTEDESELMRYTRSVIGTMTIILTFKETVGFSPPLPLGI